MNDFPKLVKEYLNMDEDLVIVDVHGFEILDSESTRGTYFKMSDVDNSLRVAVPSPFGENGRQGTSTKS